ncbi:hypothetical protein HYDPIDRAFT_166505 [Hydnomerulius pinastri MD-312]|nr:hypothetical protein HYDPIDRAFT_166505 [Hydnomerulius pinastri MD-312]
MSSEKKFWPKLRSPFRSSLGIIQDAQPDVEARRTRRSGSRVSSVYLSDDSSAHGFVIVPEFDQPARTAPAAPPEESGYSSSFRSLPTEASSGSSSSHNDVNSCFSELSPGTTPSSCPHLSEAAGKSGRLQNVPSGVLNKPDTNAHDALGGDHDLERRLECAYDHIRTMPSPVSPKVFTLSSDPRMLRKQLGVPQHSVNNHPITLLDLPNPHASQSQLPPSDSSDRTLSYSPTRLSGPITPPFRHHEVHTQSLSSEPLSSLEKPSLRADTHIPTSHLHDCFTSSHLLPNTSPMTAGPVLIESPSVHHAATGGARYNLLASSHVGSHGSHSLQDQALHKKPSKLTKRRAGHVVSSSVSSLPSSSSNGPRHIQLAEKIILLDDPSPRECKGQDPLPQLRTPSPFRVDVPMHHPWHDRRTNFDLSVGRHGTNAPTSFTEPKSRRTSVSTEALASLAWIGTPPMESSPAGADPRRRRGGVAPPSDHSQFSMAIAVGDESMTDELLVDRLERIRMTGSLSEHGHGSASSSRYSPTPLPSPVTSNDRLKRRGSLLSRFSRAPPPTSQRLESCDLLLSPILPEDPALDPDDAAIWQAARKALLCIREIVRTERKYQEALKMLLNGQTVTPPPPLMMSYIPGLIRASEMLLKGFLEDPSAWGISTAFMTCEDDIETAMVSWCAVAGAFFTEGSEAPPGGVTGKWRLRRSGMATSSSQTSISSLSSPMVKEPTTPSSPQLPPMLTLMSAASSRIKDRQRMDEEYWRTGGNSLDLEPQKTPPMSLRKQSSTKHRDPPARRLSVRDLAIQPTQRVMRYVLLYRVMYTNPQLLDLLDSTPSTSPSRPLVERALEAATRIAKKCDRAQGNTAFLRVQT